MRIFRSLEDIRGAVKNPVVTVGSYDGVHAGHRRILAELESIACEEEGESVVVTFDPHPRTVVNNDDSRVNFLNTLEEKIYLLESAGVDNLLIINFSSEFAELTSEEFARRYILDAIGAKALIIGYNHQFGRNREGGIGYLEVLQRKYGFRLVQIPKVDVEDGKVSSTVIRGLVSGGDIATADRYLGAPYLIMTRTDEYGAAQVAHDKILPPPGEYPAEIKYGVEAFDGRVVISHERQLTIHSQYTQLFSGKDIILLFR